MVTGRNLNNDLELFGLCWCAATSIAVHGKTLLHPQRRCRLGAAGVSAVRQDNKPLYFIAQIEDNDLKQSEQENQRLMERITQAADALFREERLHTRLYQTVVMTDVAMNITLYEPDRREDERLAAGDTLGAPY